MRPGRQRAFLAALLALSLAIGGCSDDDGSDDKAASSDDVTTAAFSRPEADSVVAVTARGFQFDGLPATIEGPRVLFDVQNGGSDRHDFEVVHATGDDAPVGRIEAFDQGQTRSLAVALPPGNYIARCQVKLADTLHSDLGMLSRFTVQ